MDRNLRVQLARALLSLATFPMVRSSCSHTQLPHSHQEDWGTRQLRGLFCRMSAMLQALTSPSWPAWLRGDQVRW